MRNTDAKFEELQAIEHELYVKCFNAGYSVLAISKCLAFNNAGQVYCVLRDRGVVKKLPNNRRFNVTARLAITFSQMRFSFAQWCNSWDLDPKVAEKAIELGPWETKAPGHIEVFDALKYDFHNLYLDLYEIGNEFDRKYPADRGDGPKHTLLVEWSDADGGYVASIPQVPGIRGVGATWDPAIAELKFYFNAHRRIKKLENLVRYAEENE